MIAQLLTCMDGRELNAAARSKIEVAEAGFTILELLVSLALSALLMAAVPGAIRLGARALQQAEILTNDAADRAALEFASERLTETRAPYERGADGRLSVAFSGGPSTIRFVAAAVMDPNGDVPAGLFLMELALDRSDGPASRLMLRWQPFRPGSTNIPDLFRQERALLGDVTGLAFRYFGAPAARVAAGWSDSWAGTETIPELVEIQVQRGWPSIGDPLVIRVPLRLRPTR